MSHESCYSDTRKIDRFRSGRDRVRVKYNKIWPI